MPKPTVSSRSSGRHTDPASIKRIGAVHLRTACAELGSVRALHYTTPPDPAHGIPVHVRAASAIRRSEARLFVVQDDVNAIVVIAADGRVEPVLMPRGADGSRVFDDGLGNKHLKMDLESAVVLPDGRLLAFGSGASSRRESLVMVTHELDVEIRHATLLYEPMRIHCESMGAELNIEGAVIDSSHLRLFQRSTGRRSSGARSGGAIFSFERGSFLRWLADEGPVPPIEGVIEVDLGTVDGLPVGFTDAAIGSDGRIVFLACAEDSADSRSDGPILACRFGWLDAEGARTTDIIGADGRLTCYKLEGLDPRPGAAGLFDVVADMDRPDEASLLMELKVHE